MNALDLSLPLPQWVPAIATVLSIFGLVGFIIVDVIIMISTVSAENNNRDRLRHTAFSFIAQVYSALNTIIATVALPYIFPENVFSFSYGTAMAVMFRVKECEGNSYNPGPS